MRTIFTITLLLLALGAGQAAMADNRSWDEHAGKGSINGREFPIAVVRNAGSETEFFSALQQRFGSGFQIRKLPGGVIGYGTQFLVTPFADKDLLSLPVAKDSAALEPFVLEHSMTFSLLDINGETLGVGTPVKVLAHSAPEAVPADSEYGFLRHAVKDAVRISFGFGNTVVTSLTATLTVPPQDARVILRDAFGKDGMMPATTGESAATAGSAQPHHELFSDGKSRAGNFLLSNHPVSNEVQINVNQVKVR
jgi:hypothetical protein